MKYQVTIQQRNEVSQFEIESTAPRLAWELGLQKMGFAPHKFNTTMDIEQSSTLRVVYTSKGRGETVLIGLVKPIEGELK